MMTPTLAAYYKEQDPDKRKKLLDQSIELQEEPENNEIRQKLWEIRYAEKSQARAGGRADAYLAMWMAMEFNRGAGKKVFRQKGARKELKKHVDKLQFEKFLNGSEAEQEMLYQECVHMVKLYMSLCKEDKSYNSYFGGIINMKKDAVNDKIKRDIYETAVELPTDLEIKELEILVRAAKEAFEEFYPGEGGIIA
ncbi:MAG: hypothetical protein Q4B26_01985 [Eubacteriales bacterium]|nr:hypothetical protein [Eubacteriales bacterium]